MSTWPNPLVPGFNPDPSVVLAEGAYYLVTSSFEYLPGLPVYRSTDLVDWTQIGNVGTRPEQLEIGQVPTGLGVYAPTIRYREGVFHVYFKDPDHVSRLYGSAMPYSMFFSGGQAVHYSSDFASVGYAGASHGCVNVRDYDGLAHLYSQVQVGDTVVVYWS